jgi:NAD(P)-dependent dehydrogenase (short-subunit alcohol dehydrogenase family)
MESLLAVRSFTRWILDLKGRDIRINMLSPGHIDTPGLSELMSHEQKAEATSHVPLGRLGTPDDMGTAAVFLGSDDRRLSVVSNHSLMAASPNTKSRKGRAT